MPLPQSSATHKAKAAVHVRFAMKLSEKASRDPIECKRARFLVRRLKAIEEWKGAKVRVGLNPYGIAAPCAWPR